MTRGFGDWEWHDTVPTQPAKLDACSTCQQGRYCSTPDACECAEAREDALSSVGAGVFRWTMIALAVWALLAAAWMLA